MKTTSADKLKVLLRDFGYEVQGDVIIQKGIKGHLSDYIIGRCTSIHDAAERLCPIIASGEYTRRLIAIQNPKE